MSDRFARAFNRSGATRAVAIDISKAFDSVWNAGLFHKLKFYGISGQIFGLISSFLRNIRLQVVLDGVSCTIAIYADDITLCSKCDQASDLWQQLELVSDSNLIYKTLRTGAGSGLFDLMLEKLAGFVCLV